MQLIGIHRKKKEKRYIGVRLITNRTYVGYRREGLYGDGEGRKEVKDKMKQKRRVRRRIRKVVSEEPDIFE